MLTFLVCLCFLEGSSQPPRVEINKALQEIEQNNEFLKAQLAKVSSKKLEYQASNALPSIQASAFYLPWGEHTGSDYTEFQVSQSFAFPTVYKRKKEWIDSQGKLLELGYQLERKQLLLAAKKVCLSIVNLNKRLLLLEKRLLQAEQVFIQTKTLFDQEEISILNFNKAQVAVIQERYRLKETEQQRESLLLDLQEMNGGHPLNLSQSTYSGSLLIEPFDSLHTIISVQSPDILFWEHQKTLVQQELKLTKAQGMPSFSFGVNYQGIDGSNYAGVLGGIAIPVWGQKNRVKAVASNFQYIQTFQKAKVNTKGLNYQKLYIKYQSLLEKYGQYKSTLNQLNGEEPLMKAYQLGEISYLEYYMELQFYYQAYDTMLDMEAELHLLKAELLKHQL